MGKDSVYQTGTYRPQSQPPLPRNHELRPQTTEEDSYAIIDKSLDLGINFIDSANVYGGKKSERIR